MGWRFEFRSICLLKRTIFDAIILTGGNVMSVSYRKLFALLDDKGLNKRWLRLNGIHPNTVDRLVKDGYVSTEIIERICALLDCQPGDIMEYIQEEK